MSKPFLSYALDLSKTLNTPTTSHSMAAATQ